MTSEGALASAEEAANDKPSFSSEERGKEPTKLKKAAAKNTKETPKGKKDFGFGLGVWFPQARPMLTLLLSSNSPRWSLGSRVSASYVSLSSSFGEAAKQSDYADKITISSASLSDLSLNLPEVGLWFPVPFFVTVSPVVKLSLVNANYTTTVGEPLSFIGVAVMAGAAGSGGFRLSVSPSLSLDLAAEIQFRLWDGGYSSVNFNQDNSTAVPTFTESELEHIVDSLQPYVQSIAQRTTVGGQLRMVYRF